MQDFTLHTHNNELRFDGRATADEMISSAETLGFKLIGVSNHMILKENLKFNPDKDPMFMNDFNKAYDVYMKHIDILNALKDKHKIKIKTSFEVDYFDDKTWRKNFEQMMKKLPVDYIIGSNHFLRDKKEDKFLCNIYHLKRLTTPIDEESLKEYTINHFKATINAIKSGYFTFIAHLDYCSIFNLGLTEEYIPYKEAIIEALIETKTPYELNTSGYDRINRPHPDIWMIEALNRGGVPILLSDDAHDKEKIGRYFDTAEKLLKDLNYSKRFKIKDIKNKMR